MTHQVYPISPNDMVCDTCPAHYPAAGTWLQTAERARVAKWHIYTGDSLAGGRLERTYCPQCFNRGQAQRPTRDTVMEGQLDLLDLPAPQAPVAHRSRTGFTPQ